MHEFKTFHPIVNFIYFVFVIAFGCFFMHPVCLCISLLCGFIYSVLLKGKKAIKTNLMYMLPTVIAMALMNPVFNHEGITVLAYLPGGNPLTLEAILYGLAAATMLVSILCWFSCYNEIMTSDKFIYLFGKVVPSLSLIISMTLRFVPKFTTQLKVVATAQKCIGRDVTTGSIAARAKHGLHILSVMTTWALENAIETADSMKSRGYGLPGRTAFSVFTFDTRDRKSVLYILILGIYTFVGAAFRGMSFQYFPMIKGNVISLFEISIFISYLLLCSYPILIEIREVRKWKALRSKI